MSGKRPEFLNRVRIVGSLKLTSELSIGDGNAKKEKQLQGDGEVEIATIVLADCSKPTIPGAALRGVLRGYLESRVSKKLFESVFGKASASNSVNRGDLKDDEMGHGGKVEFAYAKLIGENPKLAVQTHVGIERTTRTAADRILHSSQCVPRGTVFKVEITGFNLTDEEIGLLLCGLHGFNDQVDPIRLGANHADFGGAAEWATGSIEVTKADDVKRWWDKPVVWNSRPAATAKPEESKYLSLESIPKLCETSRFRPDSSRISGFWDRFLVSKKDSTKLNIKIALHFNSPLLVNDPNKTRPKKPNTEGERKRPHHSPRRLPNGEVYLPASSFRGAFRSQAERIVRTLNPERAKDPNAGPAGSHADENDLVKALFGHAGQRAKLAISDFVAVEASKELAKSEGVTQEFIAIDRFTGGGAEHLKFNAERVNKELTLEGTISLNSDDPVSLGLLILTLRDLIEGDISFGWGASKGYGHCTADVEGWPSIGGLELNKLKEALNDFRKEFEIQE